MRDPAEGFAPETLDETLLDLLPRMAKDRPKAFKDGQLGIAGSRDPLGVAGSRDPQGDDCDCQSIKNFPSITHSKEVDPAVFDKQVINMFR